MSSMWGNKLRCSIFGESHSQAIGVVIDGLPAGFAIDFESLRQFQARRAPGKNRMSTARQEADFANVLCGFHNGVTTGTPLCAVIENTNTRSSDYSQFQTLARPGHADFTGFLRYHGFNDIRGGGHFSGRLTAPLVFAGGICKQILESRGITVGVHIASIAGVSDRPFDPVSLTPDTLLEPAKKRLAVLDDEAGALMETEIEKARLDTDSVGGVVECAILGMPAGVGSPMFDGIENRIASLVFGIPAVKGLEFGRGFAASGLRGSENNDPFVVEDGKIKTSSNHHGGILGGISSGMPIIFRVAFKPTASISKQQQTVDFVHGTPSDLVITGRHDPCIVPRGAVCVEAAAALAVLDLLMQERGETPAAPHTEEAETISRG